MMNRHSRSRCRPCRSCAAGAAHRVTTTRPIAPARASGRRRRQDRSSATHADGAALASVSRPRPASQCLGRSAGRNMTPSAAGGSRTSLLPATQPAARSAHDVVGATRTGSPAPLFVDMAVPPSPSDTGKARRVGRCQGSACRGAGPMPAGRTAARRRKCCAFLVLPA